MIGIFQVVSGIRDSLFYVDRSHSVGRFIDHIMSRNNIDCNRQLQTTVYHLLNYHLTPQG